MFKSLKTKAVAALATVLMAAPVVTPAAHAADFASYSDAGRYAVRQVGQFDKRFAGPLQMLPSGVLNHVDFLPIPSYPGEKFPFVVFTGGAMGDGRYAEQWVRNMVSHGFAVRVAYGQWNWTGEVQRAALRAAAAEIARGGSPLTEVADFGRTGLVGHSAGAGATVLAANTNGEGIPGFRVGAVVTVGLTLKDLTALNRIGADVPNLMIYGQLDPTGGIALPHAYLRQNPNKNASIVSIWWMEHRGVEHNRGNISIINSFLDAALKNNGELRRRIAAGDPSIYPPKVVFSRDATPAARNWA